MWGHGFPLSECNLKSLLYRLGGLIYHWCIYMITYYYNSCGWLHKWMNGSIILIILHYYLQYIYVAIYDSYEWEYDAYIKYGPLKWDYSLTVHIPKNYKTMSAFLGDLWRFPVHACVHEQHITNSIQ